MMSLLNHCHGEVKLWSSESRVKSSLLELCRVVTEQGEAKRRAKLNNSK